MVNVIIRSHAIFKMHIIVDGREDVLFCNMLRDQIVNVTFDQRFHLFDVSCGLFDNSRQNRIIYLLRNTYFFRIDICNSLKIYHHIRKDLDVSLFIFTFYPQIRNGIVLDLICKFTSNLRTFFSNYLSRKLTHRILCKYAACNTVFQHQFLIEFITSNLCEIISSRIKEHAVDQTFRAVYCKRLARADLLVQFQKTFLITLRSVLCKACKDLRLFTEKINNLCIRSDTKCTDQHCDRNFSCTIDAHIKNVVGVCLIFKPCASVWDHCR